MIPTWLNVVGLVAFAVLLGAGFHAFRQGTVIGSRVTFGVLLGAGLVLLVIGVGAVIASAT